MNLAKKLGLFFVALGALGGATLLIYKNSPKTTQTKKLQGIIDFDYERDRQFILDIFDKNMYWLVDKKSSPDFSAEYMMRYLTTNNNPSTAGYLTIKVLYDDGQPVGFTAYYMKHFYLGQIRFVAVCQECRSRGYGRKLMDYALQDLQSRGAAKVRLVTRTNNIPAQKLYHASGMHISQEEDGFVWFEKEFDSK